MQIYKYPFCITTLYCYLINSILFPKSFKIANPLLFLWKHLSYFICMYYLNNTRKYFSMNNYWVLWFKSTNQEIQRIANYIYYMFQENTEIPEVLANNHYSLRNTQYHYNVCVKYGINMIWMSSVNLAAKWWH